MNHVRVTHPGYWHSGEMGDGSYVTCHGCGVMVDCYSPDQTHSHMLVCAWVPIPRPPLQRPP